MKRIKKKLLTIMMFSIMLCSTLMIPAADCKAAVCSHPYSVVKYTEHVGQSTDYHVLFDKTICWYQIDDYNAYYYCGVCGVYTYTDAYYTVYHVNPNCPY